MKKKSIGLVLALAVVWIASINILQAGETHTVHLPVVAYSMPAYDVGDPPMPAGLD